MQASTRLVRIDQRTKMDLNTNLPADSDADLVWNPRPQRQVLPEDLEPGDVIIGHDGGHATVDEADEEGYLSEFGLRRWGGLVDVVADDDIMGTDPRKRTAEDIIDGLYGVDGNLEHRHFRLNQLFLWGVVVRIEDWDHIIQAAQATDAGRDAIASLDQSPDRLRVAVGNGLSRHNAKNERLGLDRVLYRSYPSMF
jgi:hypothetical protein